MANKAIKERDDFALELRYYAKCFLGIVGRSLPVKEVEDKNAIGYTTPKGIYLFKECDMLKNYTKEQRTAFRAGVFLHETAHQLYTSFETEEKYVKKLRLDDAEGYMFRMIANIVEDPAIERLIQNDVGGHLIDCLKYAIATTYKETPLIELREMPDGTKVEPSPFEQWNNALIQFGDMGLLKGKFLSEEAADCFLKTAPLMYEAINTRSFKKRLELSYEIYKIGLPLFEKQVEEMRKQIENERELARAIKKLIDEIMKQNGKSMESGSGSSGSKSEDFDGTDSDGDGDGDGDGADASGKEARRKKLLEALKNGSVKIVAKPKKNGKKGDEESECGTSGGEKEGEKGEEKGGSGSDKSDKSDSESKDGEGNDGGGSKDESQLNGGNDSECVHSEYTPGEGAPGRADDGSVGITIDYNSYNGEDFAEESEAEISEEEYNISDEDIESIKEDLEKFSEKEEKAAYNDSDEPSASDLKLPVNSPRFKSATCLNKIVHLDNPEAFINVYQGIVEELNTGIKNLTSQLRRMFTFDSEETEYRTSGKVNVIRCNSARVTSRIFDRRVTPHNKSNLAIEILIDESGSMCSRAGGSKPKCQCAREAAIALAEVFGKLNIPIYVIGFTADQDGVNATHYHYITWGKNTPANRLKLMKIDAESNNFDGYSIRYGGEILKKKNAEHKLMFVISDGQPACRKYYGVDGVADTRDAIRDVRKYAEVVGVALGDEDTGVLFSMYGKDFLHINNTNELFSGIAGKIKNVIKNW